MSNLIRYGVVTLLLVLVIVAALGWISVSISLDHARQQQSIERERSILLADLFGAGKRGTPRSEILKLIRENAPKARIIKEEPDHISTDGLIYEFDDKGLLTEIRASDE